MFIRSQVCLFSFLHACIAPSGNRILSSDAEPVPQHGKNSKSPRIRAFLADQRGLNTVELVVIIAVVVGLALLFRARITAFVTTLLDGLFSVDVARNLVKGVTVE